MNEVLDAVEARAIRQGHGWLESGNRELDQLLGGLRPGELAVVAGRPSTGKSTLALEIVAHVAIASKLPTLFISSELPGREAAERLLALESSIPLPALRVGQMRTSAWSALGGALRRLTQCPLWINEGLLVGAAEIGSAARHMKDELGLSLIVIDSVQSMWSGSGLFRRGQSSEVFGLRLIAREFEVPIIIFSQLDRTRHGSEQSFPRLEDLKSYDDLEDADVVVILEQTTNAGSNDITARPSDRGMTMTCVKNRNGRTGVRKTQLRLTQLYDYSTYGSEGILKNEDG